MVQNQKIFFFVLYISIQKKKCTSEQFLQGRPRGAGGSQCKQTGARGSCLNPFQLQLWVIKFLLASKCLVWVEESCPSPSPPRGSSPGASVGSGQWNTIQPVGYRTELSYIVLSSRVETAHIQTVKLRVTKIIIWLKKLSFCHKSQFYNTYISTTRWCIPFI